MDKPKVGGTEPTKVGCSVGKTFIWCTCGRSKSQPFCDGAHLGTEFQPLKVTPDKDGDVWLCNCKQTKTPPYCDGSHNNMEGS